MGAQIRGNSTGRQGSTRIRASRGVPTVEEDYHFLIEADAVDEPYINIRNATGLPRVGHQRGILVARSIACTRKPNAAKLWDVVISYSSEVEEGSQGFEQSPDPQTWIPVRQTKFERMQEVVGTDQSDEAIVNSAGEPFDVGLTISRFIPIWEFFQFEAATVDDETIIDRNEIVNAISYKGKDAKTWLLTVEDSTIGFFFGRRLRLTLYSLRYNSKKWTHKRLDKGSYYIDGSDKVNFEIDGVPFVGNLDGSGGEATTPDPPAILEFDMYPTSSFTFLRI